MLFRSENYERTLMAVTSPMTDRKGNIYFVGYNRYLYALDSSGERKWGKKTFSDPLVLCEEGLIVGAPGGIRLIDFDGHQQWERDTSVRENIFLAPDGFLVGSTSTGLVSYDSKGKIRWYLAVKDDEYKLLSLQKYFFDTKANGYYVYNAYMPLATDDNEKQNHETHTVLVSVTPEGKIRWTKKVSGRFNFLDDFLPTKESLVRDTFLLAFHQAEREESPETWTQDWQYESHSRWFRARGEKPKIIKAFNTDGEELWQLEETRQGLHDLGYAIDLNNNFYFPFNERLVDDGAWPLVSAHLMSWSKEGDLHWSTAIPYMIETPPLLDKRQHLYIGVEEGDTNLMAFFSDGSEKWRTKVDVLYRYRHSLTFGPDRSLYFTSKDQSLLFCVRERKQ